METSRLKRWYWIKVRGFELGYEYKRVSFSSLKTLEAHHYICEFLGYEQYGDVKTKWGRAVVWYRK